MDLIDKIENEIEVMLHTVDIYEIYQVAVFSMFRTNQLLKKMEANSYYSSVNKLSIFVENNKYKILDLSPEIIYGEICQFLDESAELVENCDYEEESLIYELEYEVFENWYNFVNTMKYGFTKDDKNTLIEFILFPLTFLDDYLSNFYDEKCEEVEIQSVIEKDICFTMEIRRIFEDIDMITSLKEGIKKQVDIYLKLDITENN